MLASCVCVGWFSELLFGKAVTGNFQVSAFRYITVHYNCKQ